jgi:hypothetical protein
LEFLTFQSGSGTKAEKCSFWIEVKKWEQEPKSSPFHLTLQVHCTEGRCVP